MNKTPEANRKHIAIFGKTNSGKSSLLNAIMGQEVSIVSKVKGTTTDPVRKAMEFIPLGPVLFIDTAGLGDEGELGELRIKKTMKILQNTDFAIYVMDINDIDFSAYEQMKKSFKKYSVPYMLVISKIDTFSGEKLQQQKKEIKDAVFVTCQDLGSILNLKDEIAKRIKEHETDETIIGDLVPYDGTVVLVVPVDSEAPKGRIILPQVQVIRDCLDHGIKSYVVRDTELKSALSDLKSVDLVVTDSQAFKRVDEIVPKDIMLTSFSILYARYKGDLKTFVNDINKISTLNENSKILIAESCTHNFSHEDIGRVKIPRLLREYTKKDLKFEFMSGHDFAENPQNYDLIIHCGSCMFNRKEMISRINACVEHGVGITNYGVLLAHLNGILERSLEVFERNPGSTSYSVVF